MSNSPNFKNFVPVSGYKDVFYNPTNCFLDKNKDKDKYIKKEKDMSYITRSDTTLNKLNNSKLLKRKKSTENLRIDTEIEDWSNKEKNIKSNSAKVSDVLNSSFETLNPVFLHRQNILNKHNLNSQKSLFVFPTPTQIMNDSIAKITRFDKDIDKDKDNEYFCENIYQKIKEHMIKIISEDSMDKKITMTDNIIELLKEAKIDEKKLSIFLSNL